jgi:hypothetical protein
MPAEIACPVCRNAIQYSSNLAGTDVVCPHCSQTFQMPRLQAAGDASASKPPIAARPPARTQDPSTAGGLGIDTGNSQDRYSAPQSSSAKRGGNRGQSVAAAKSKVQMPAIFMLIFAGLGVAIAVLAVGNVLYIYANTDPEWRRYFMGRNADAILMLRAGYGVVCLLAMGFAAYGALQMMQLQDYGLAKFASIIMLIPIFSCCIVSFPFGLWSLLTLNNPDVRRAFRSGKGSLTRRYR